MVYPPKVWRAFFRKVFGILSVQLLLTGAIVAACMFHEELRYYIQRSKMVYLVATIITFIYISAMTCCENVRRKFPTNLISLGIFTGTEGIMLGKF